MKISWRLLAALVLSALATSVHANVPDPARSYIPKRLISCPAGDSTYVVFVRFFSGDPWAKSPVSLELCSCGGYRLSSIGAHPYTVDSTGCVVSMQGSRQTGAALFPLAGGGLCPDDSILVEAEGVPLGYTHVVSLDQNGDLMVDATDVALVQSKVGTDDPTADFDGDGQVTTADVAIVTAHLGHHAADATTAVGPQTPSTLALSAPRPNPFQGEARFALTLAGEAPVDVSVFDLDGRRIATLFHGALGAGTREFAWGGRRADGAVSHSGLYFVRATVADRSLSRRAIYLGGR